jgi:ATP-dependent protease ClpP protease subunit
VCEEEAKAFGLIDRVVASRTEIKIDDKEK